MPRKVLKEQYEGRLEPDEMKTDLDINDDVEDYTSYDAGNEFIREFAAQPPTQNVEDESKDDNLAKDSYATSSKIPPHTKSRDSDTGMCYRVTVTVVIFMHLKRLSKIPFFIKHVKRI